LGTASVQSSEILSRMLKREKIVHNVLNAKYHMQEAEIVARAGLKGAVTVATNMAGRGTDIKLGEGVREAGGLFVIATERHQSRRIDRQLRGRCSRQGDPGMSVFYVSFEDDLMVKFGAAERMTRMMERFGLEEGQELEHKWLNKSVENAQKKVEQRNYLGRKHILEYDDVMNNQRAVVYGYRNRIIQTEDPHSMVLDIIEEQIPTKAEEFFNPDSGDLDYDAFLEWVNIHFPVGLSPEAAEFETRDIEGNLDFIIERVKAAYNFKCAHEDPDVLENLERYIILKNIDEAWIEHLYEMDGLRESIGNYRYAQKDPLVEYKLKAYEIFTGLMDGIRNSALETLFSLTTQRPEDYQNIMRNMPQNLSSNTDILSDFAGSDGLAAASAHAAANPQAPAQPQITLPIKREEPKVGRNDPCPCGSGKKYKKCCGKISAGV
ncbi:MAG: preprotein translocase subunit SecA, partial [Verrucomicrobiales bacterium]|nr:preprotein translocase subunit SecA [Verrucomicrobiales bacterium]